MIWWPSDKYVWDFWFAREGGGGGRLHVYYLQAGREESGNDPDRRHDLASVGHAVMGAGGWEELTAGEPAFSRGKAGAWDDLSIWTGCVVENPLEGGWYLFYTSRRRADSAVWTPSEWQRPQQIGLAVSDDLMEWKRSPKSVEAPLIANPGAAVGLDGVAWRDPYVMREEGGGYLVFICARLGAEAAAGMGIGEDAGGAVAWLSSDRLDQWDPSRTSLLIASEEFYQLEVPQAFWRACDGGKRFYLIFSAQEKDCSAARRAKMPAKECRTGTYYLSSDLLPLDHPGIPKLREPARLLAEGWYAGRILDAEDGRPPLFFGFKWADAEGNFVGGISDGMPVVFGPDGSIGLG